ncbi:MAG: SurA N-terminal domain-containing protein [Thermodesulfobacteriota bacterium]
MIKNSRVTIKPVAAFFLLLLVLILPGKADAEVVDRIVAVVNDSIITLTELNAAAVLAEEEYKGLSKEELNSIEVKSQILDNIIEQKLVKQAADNAGIEVSEAELDKAIEEVKSSGNMTQEALFVALAKSGLTYKEYRAQLTEQIREVKYVDKAFRSKVLLEREDIDEYFHQNREKFVGPSKVRLRIIYLSSEDKELQNDRLMFVIRGIDDGEEFSTLAKAYSDGPNPDKGGDLGYVVVSELDPAIAKASEKLELNEISAPIPSDMGVTIIQLLDKKDKEMLELTEVEGYIRKTLYDRMVEETFNHWLKEIKRIAHIEVRL